MVGRCVIGLALLGLLGAGCAPSPESKSPREESVSTPNKPPPPLKANLSTILREGTDFELISIRPGPVRREEGESVELFRKYRRLGSTKVTDNKIREDLVVALERAASEMATPYMCFKPRHAIRVKYREATYDVVICFECEQAYAKKGEEMLVEFLVSPRHQDSFDKVLFGAGVPLAERPK